MERRALHTISTSDGDIKINVSSKGSWYKGCRTHLATYIKERVTPRIPLPSDGNGNAYFFLR